MADRGSGDVLGEDVLPSTRPRDASELARNPRGNPPGASDATVTGGGALTAPGTEIPPGQARDAAAGSGGTTGAQKEIDAMAVAGGGMPSLQSRQPRALAELDEAVAALEKAAKNVPGVTFRATGTAVIAAISGIVIGAIVAFVVANDAVSGYEGRLTAAANTQISAIKKAAAAERVRIDIEAGNKLVEINEAATKAAAARAAEAEKVPVQATAPAKATKPAEGEKPATEEQKPATVSPAQVPAAPPTVTAPAPAQPAASSELSALMDKLQKGMKKGGK